MFFKNRNQNSEMSKILGKYIDKVKIDEILSSENENSNFRDKSIIFLLISFKQDDSLLNDIDKTITLLRRYDCVIEELNQVYVKCSIGSLEISKTLNKEEEIQKILSGLKDSKSWYSIVWGNRNAKIGNIGSKDRKSYCSVIPDFKKSLLKLFELNEGEIYYMS